jgi:hypothetical protein
MTVIREVGLGPMAPIFFWLPPKWPECEIRVEGPGDLARNGGGVRGAIHRAHGSARGPSYRLCGVLVEDGVLEDESRPRGLQSQGKDGQHEESPCARKRAPGAAATHHTFPVQLLYSYGSVAGQTGAPCPTCKLPALRRATSSLPEAPLFSQLNTGPTCRSFRVWQPCQPPSESQGSGLHHLAPLKIRKGL